MTTAEQTRVYHGIAYRVELRATPGCNADGLPDPGSVMWSADLLVGQEGSGYTAAAGTPALALAELARLVAERSVEFPDKEKE